MLRGNLTENEARRILKIINSRVSQNLPDNKDTNDIHICGINKQVDDINKLYKLEIGCKVICNTKCKDSGKKTIPNGSIGMIIESDMNDFSKKNNSGGLKIKWGDDTISTFKGIGKNSSGKPRFTPAYALTIHKAQGKTIKRNVIINPSRLFAKNHLYVALTRATKFSNVYLTEPMSYRTFCNTVNVKTPHSFDVENHSNRLERMLTKYIIEEPALTLEFLQGMKKQQKNKCCYCGVGMCNLFGQSHSITLERVDDSKPHISSNIKFACFSCNSAHRK
jgi:hypothetical protein